MTKKELEKTITELIDSPERHDYKKHALEELDEIEEAGLTAMHCAFIVEQYPDFNNVNLKVTSPGHFVLSVSINPDDFKDVPPKKKKKAIKGLVNMFAEFTKHGHIEE